MGQLPPIRSNPRAPPIQPSDYRDHRLPAGCCVFSLVLTHLQPRNIRLSILWCVLFGTPQTSKPTMAPPNPTTVALNGNTWVWGRGAMCCGRHWPTHRGRGQNCWEVGQWQLMLVVVCYCVLCCDHEWPHLATDDTYFVKSWYRIGQKWPIFAHSWQKLHQQTNQMLRHVQSPHGVRTLHIP